MFHVIPPYLLWCCFRSLYLKSYVWRRWINYIIWFSLKSLPVKGFLAWENISTKSIEFLVTETQDPLTVFPPDKAVHFFLMKSMFWECLYPSLWKDTIHSETLRFFLFQDYISRQQDSLPPIYDFILVLLILSYCSVSATKAWKCQLSHCKQNNCKDQN